MTIIPSPLTPRASFLIANEYLYTGRRLDPETGLQLNRNRFYYAALGRWLNRDPIGYEGSPWNLYEYVSGMPTIGLDPDGLDFFDDKCFGRCKRMECPEAAAECATLCWAIKKLAKKLGINKCEAMNRLCQAMKNGKARAACEIAYTALCPRG